MDYHACIDLEIEGRVWCPQLDVIATIDADWTDRTDWFVTGIRLSFADGHDIELNEETDLYKQARAVLEGRAHRWDITQEWANHRAASRASAERQRELARAYA